MREWPHRAAKSLCGPEWKFLSLPPGIRNLQPEPDARESSADRRASAHSMTENDPTPADGNAFQGTHAEVVAELVENHRRFLAFVERRVGDRGVAEEILQDAFVRGVERVGSLRSDESAVAWFFRMLRNAIVDHHRRSGTVVRSAARLEDEGEPSAPDAELEAEACRCVLGLAETLKPEYAAALQRVDVEGISVQAFAAEAGITPNNASVRLFRARDALKKRVDATCRTCADHGCLDCTCTGQGDPVHRSGPASDLQ